MTWLCALTYQLVIVLTLLVGLVPLRAQQPLHHVGILNYAGPSDIRANQFNDALRALGYREGSNLKLTHKWADGKMDELPVLAAQLVADKVDVIIALGPAVWAARNATTTIPIVIAFSGDPVGQNVVASLAKPGETSLAFHICLRVLQRSDLSCSANIFPRRNALPSYSACRSQLLRWS